MSQAHQHFREHELISDADVTREILALDSPKSSHVEGPSSTHKCYPYSSVLAVFTITRISQLLLVIISYYCRYLLPSLSKPATNSRTTDISPLFLVIVVIVDSTTDGQLLVINGNQRLYIRSVMVDNIGY